jgi:hypothetical protein
MSVAAVVVSLVLGAHPASALAPGWSSPKRVFDGASDLQHSMAVGPSGRTHIAVEDPAGGIWYLTNAGGAWSSTKVTDGIDRDPSIAVTAGGDVIIAFDRRDPADGSVSLGIFTVGNRTGEFVERQRYDGQAFDPSLAWRDGVLHLALRGADGSLVHLTDAGGNWVASTVAPGGPDRCCDGGPSLGIDPAGRPVIAWSRRSGPLRIAVKDGDAWTTATVDPKDTATPSLATPASGPLIAYVRDGVGTFLAFMAGGDWFSTKLDGGFTDPPDIAVSGNGTAFIAEANGRKVRLLEIDGRRSTRTAVVASGRDGHPEVGVSRGSPRLVFSRGAPDGGVYFTRRG